MLCSRERNGLHFATKKKSEANFKIPSQWLESIILGL